MEIIWQTRKALPDDSAGLKACMEAAYAVYQARMGGEKLPPVNVDYTSEIENYPTWVVESRGIIIGGLVMVFEREYARIANIAIDPGFQGKGIGGKLMQYAESKAIEKEISELRLGTHVLLGENIDWYRYLGWQETGRDGTRVLMKKEI